jgi:translocation and assembly module TamB
MKRRTKIISEVIFFGFLFLLFSLVYWLLYTAGGLNWSLKTINRAAGPILEYHEVKGAWLTQMEFGNLTVLTPVLDIKGENLRLEISISNLMSGTLDIIAAKATTLTLLSKPATGPDTQKEKQPSSPQPGRFSLAVEIAIQSLQVDALRFEQPEQDPWVLQNITADNSRIKRRIDIGSLTADSDYGKISVSGALVPDIDGEIELATDFTLYAMGQMPQLQGSAELNGTINDFSLQGQLTQPYAIQVDAELASIDRPAHWRAQISADHVPLQDHFTQIPLTLDKVTLNGEGGFDEYKINGTTTLKHQDFGQWNSQWKVVKTQSQWLIDSLTLNNAQTDTTINASGTADGGYAFNASTIVSLQADWQNLQWPLSDTALVTSENGSLSLAGSYNEYNISTEGKVVWSNNEISDIAVTAQGTPRELTFDTVSADLLQGNIKGSGKLNFADELRWRADTTLSSIDLHALYANLNTTLSSKVLVEGAVQNEKVKTTFSISGLKGQVNQRPVAGKAKISLDGNHLQITGLNVRSGKSRLSGAFAYQPRSSSQASSSQTAKLNANWDLHIADLQLLTTDLQGSVTSKGSITGALDRLAGQLQLQASSIQFENYKLDNANLDADIDLTEKTESRIYLAMKQATLGGLPVESLQLDITGTAPQHSIKMVVTQDPKNQLAIRGTGNWQNDRWEFSTRETLLRTEQFGQWRQTQTAVIEAAADRFAVNLLCLSRENATDNTEGNNSKNAGNKTNNSINKGELCGSVDSKDYKNWESDLRIRTIPFAMFKEFLPPQFDSIDVDISGRGQFKYSQQRGALLNFKASGENGVISGIKIEGEDTTVAFNHMEFALSNLNGRLEATTSVSIQDTGNIELAFAFPHWSKLAIPPFDERIQGHVDVDLTNLALLAVISNDIKNPVGKWQSDIAISGTLQAPVLVGESRLQASSLTLTRLGLTLRDVDLKATSDEKRAVTISGSAKSGKGKVNISGSLNDYRAAEPTGSINIKGENFELARIPEATIIVSPDLHLTLNENAIKMTGDILIPEANLTIFTPTKTITPSPDVVIVSKEQTQKTPPPLNLSSKIRIILGDNVKVQGYGFTGRLKGSVLVDDSGELTTASGEINIVEGKYAAYGTTLDIARGSLSFAGGSIDNPLVDVRAQRVVGDVTAGVLAQGNIQSPKISLFSIPPMDDSNTLSYIILGQPLNAASDQDGKLLANAAASLGLLGGEKLAKEIGERFGIDEIKIQTDETTNDASLLLGKYLSPDFYVGYAIGIGNAVDTLQIQYKLTEQWVLKTSSGEQQKAEILFSIEKD